MMRVIKECFPDFRKLSIHESSPGGRGVSTRLKNECTNYSFSHYFADTPPGEINKKTNAQCENLEKMTFADKSFDLFITQDVMEHIFNPQAAFREIARVLRPGGAHIFTAPLVNKWRQTQTRASLREDGQIAHHMEPEYHGNPVDPEGSLMTINWGYDIANFISTSASMPTIIVQIDDIDSGIRAEYIEVLVSRRVQNGNN